MGANLGVGFVGLGKEFVFILRVVVIPEIF